MNIDKLINEALNEAKVGLNAGQVRELAHRMEDHDPVFVVDKNGRIKTIVDYDPDGDEGPGLYLYVN